MRNYIIILAIFIVGCRPSPSEINYYEDECVFCKMKISDPNFGAELVTHKGKIFKYDSAECLFRHYIEKKESGFAFVLVTDYTKPHQLVDAFTATYLVSENLPSPMGGNLSAYEKKEVALNIQSEKDGKIYDFEGMLQEYKKVY